MTDTLPVPAPETRPASAGKTLITLLLDRSRSMERHKEPTLVAVNSWKNGLRETPGDARLSVVFFDANPEVMDLQKLHVAVPVAEVPDLGWNDYHPRGNTPLIDAAMTTILAIEESLAGRTDVKVILAIQTDGEENKSKRYDWEQLKVKIAEREAAGWEISFMGAGGASNAYRQAAMMGIDPAKTVSYGLDARSTKAAFDAHAQNTSLYASGALRSTAYSMEQKLAAGDRHDLGEPASPNPGLAEKLAGLKPGDVLAGEAPRAGSPFPYGLGLRGAPMSDQAYFGRRPHHGVTPPKPAPADGGLADSLARILGGEGQP